MKKLVFIFAALSLTACMHVKVNESQFIRPDKLTQYKSGEAFTQQALDKIASNAALKEISLVVNPNQELKGLNIEQAQAKAKVLYFGGNLSHVDEMAPAIMRQVGSCGINVTTFDYRGYGRTTGEPSVKNLQEDALRIYDEMRAKHQGPLVLHGHSLGSFMVAHILRNRTVDAVVLEATATNIDDIVRFNTPWYAKPFVNFEIADSLLTIDNPKSVSQYHGKALVITGQQDHLFGAELGHKVFDAIPSDKKQHAVLQNGSHTGMLKREEAKTVYCNFIRDVAATPTHSP